MIHKQHCIVLYRANSLDEPHPFACGSGLTLAGVPCGFSLYTSCPIIYFSVDASEHLAVLSGIDLQPHIVAVTKQNFLGTRRLRNVPPASCDVIHSWVRYRCGRRALDAVWRSGKPSQTSATHCEKFLTFKHLSLFYIDVLIHILFIVFVNYLIPNSEKNVCVEVGWRTI